jgi:hypothetical protein
MPEYNIHADDIDFLLKGVFEMETWADSKKSDEEPKDIQNNKQTVKKGNFNRDTCIHLIQKNLDTIFGHAMYLFWITVRAFG